MGNKTIWCSLCDSEAMAVVSELETPLCATCAEAFELGAGMPWETTFDIDDFEFQGVRDDGPVPISLYHSRKAYETNIAMREHYRLVMYEIPRFLNAPAKEVEDPRKTIELILILLAKKIGSERYNKAKEGFRSAAKIRTDK